jgi:3-oxoadipate enol-lactonase
MPFVENQGAKLYWDEQGSGEPLLLIMGLSYPSYMWHRSRPVLANSYRTIALDNRGVGQSDVPPGIYSIALMASDAAAVMDAAGVESAHVFGVSMGGMIAQEFALQYPSRVRSLILGCTAAGGPHAVQHVHTKLSTSATIHFTSNTKRFKSGRWGVGTRYLITEQTLKQAIL